MKPLQILLMGLIFVMPVMAQDNKADDKSAKSMNGMPWSSPRISRKVMIAGRPPIRRVEAFYNQRLKILGLILKVQLAD